MPRESTAKPIADRVTKILAWATERIDPKATAPEAGELAQWVKDGDCPHAAMTLTGVYIILNKLPEQFHPDPQGNDERIVHIEQCNEAEDGDLEIITILTWGSWDPEVLFTQPPGVSSGVKITVPAKLTELADIWNTLQDEERGQDQREFPLTPLLRAWINRPRPAPPSRRSKDRIMPARAAMAPAGDRREGKFFSIAAHVEHRPNGQFVLPGFQQDRQAPALPLALYDLGLGATEHRGRNPAAPLALRLWVASILLTRQQDRHGNHPIALELPLRELLAELYPGRRPKPNEYWPRLMKAAEALGSPEARVPWYDPELDRGGQQHVVLVGNIPRGPGALNDHVQLIVNLPPGSEHGPQVSDNLAVWGVKSDRAYRSLLNLAYWWFDPGVTARPLGQRSDGQGRFWAQSKNQKHYPTMSDEQLVQIVFPTSTKKNFRHLVSDAHKVLVELQVAGEIDIIDGKPVPPRQLPPSGQRRA